MQLRMLRLARMAVTTGRTAALRSRREGRLWAVLVERP